MNLVRVFAEMYDCVVYIYHWTSWCGFHMTICRNVVAFCDIVLFYISSWLQLKISMQEFTHWTCTIHQKHPYCC